MEYIFVSFYVVISICLFNILKISVIACQNIGFFLWILYPSWTDFHDD